jgi:hypothetical protein
MVTRCQRAAPRANAQMPVPCVELPDKHVAVGVLKSPNLLEEGAYLHRSRINLRHSPPVT